jgi:hypothetical protein
MKRFVFILVFGSTLWAGIDWFGYYEGEIDWGKFPEQTFFFEYNKLRLDLDACPVEQIRISADVICKQFLGQTELNFLDYVDSQYRPDNIPVLPYCFSDTLYVDNLFLQLHHRLFDLTLGKQQISPGVGYAWNPSDIFNQKDLMDPTYEQTGVSAIRLSIPLAGRVSLQGILQPGHNWDETVQYYLFKSGLGRFDFSLVYGRSLYRETGLTGVLIWKRDLYGLNMAGELQGLGIHSEITMHRLDYQMNDLKYEYVLGTDYTFKNSLYLLVEYYHSDLGVTVAQTTLDDYLIYFAGERKSINRNYLFGLVLYPVTDLLDAGFFSIANCDDRSLVFIPQFTYRIFQNVEVIFMGTIFVGERGDEFGYQKLGARLRLRAYF